MILKNIIEVLVLDDDPGRHKGFAEYYKKDRNGYTFKVTPVYTVKEAMDALDRQPYDVIQLDHDLGGKVFTPSDCQSGWQVAKYLLTIWSMLYKDRSPEIIVHSYNKVGALEIMKLFVQVGIPVRYRPYGRW